MYKGRIWSFVFSTLHESGGATILLTDTERKERLKHRNLTTEVKGSCLEMAKRNEEQQIRNIHVVIIGQS